MQPISLSSLVDTLGAFAIPVMQYAAFVRICLVRLLSPASAIGYIRHISFVPIYGLTSPDAIVVSNNLGTPKGRDCITADEIAAPMEPP